jgi:hypothetical protein
MTLKGKRPPQLVGGDMHMLIITPPPRPPLESPITSEVVSSFHQSMQRNEVSEYMVSSLNGEVHSALLGRPGSGVTFNGQRQRWIPESDENEYEMLSCLILF